MSKRKKKNRANKKNRQPKPVKSQTGIKRFQVMLEFKAPFITQQAGVMPLGVDAAMQRDSNGTPVINGSLLKGNIRHALQTFQEITDDPNLQTLITQWFGEASDKGSYHPKRAQADFDFYWKLQPESALQNSRQRTRISIDNETGTVTTGALQIIEDCFPAGSDNPQFIGSVLLRHQKGNEAKLFEQWLNKALQYIPAMGSFKGTGFGKLLKAEIRNIPLCQSTVTNQLSNTSRFGFQLKPDRPFCLGKPQTPDSNRIISDEIISGNVIKALIARSYHNNSHKLEEELCFDQLIISHAQPVAETQTPIRQEPLPLSLSLQKIKNQQGETEECLIDLAEDPEAESRALQNKQALTFSIDWKPQDEARVNKELKRRSASPQRTLILRTGIDREIGTAADSQLFSLECIEPDNFIWCGDIELGNIPAEKRQQVMQKLQSVLSKGLYGMGKTRARLQTKLQQEPFKPAPISLEAGQNYIVKLLSKALMLPQDMHLSGTNSYHALKHYYKSYWQQIDPELELQNYYAQQTLASSYYHTQAKESTLNTQYAPDWLSCEGSVFILKANTEKAARALQACQQSGLPVYKKDNKTPSWKETPYLPENGFGEISIKKQEASHE